MDTPALTIRELARMIHRTAEAAYDEHLRGSGETDAEILGKLTVLDVICDPLWVSDHNKMTELEEALLGEAREALNNAYDFLKDRIAAPAPVPTKATRVQFEAKQKVRAEKLSGSEKVPL